MFNKMVTPTGGSGETTILEGITETKYGNSVVSYNYNNTTAIVSDNWTGNYLKHTYDSKVEVLQKCKIAYKKGSDAIVVGDYNAGDTLFTYTYTQIGSGFSVVVLG